MRHFLPTGQSLEIRPAQLSDAPACLRYFLQLTQETDFLLYTHAEASAYDLQAEEDYIRSYLPPSNSLLLVAVVDNAVIGALALDQGHFRKQQHIVTLGIGILHTYWNMGIGRRMMTAAERWVEEHPVISMIRFEVLATNERAIQLYRNFNYTEHGRIPQGIRQPDGSWADLLIMSKRIKSM